MTSTRYTKISEVVCIITAIILSIAMGNAETLRNRETTRWAAQLGVGEAEVDSLLSAAGIDEDDQDFLIDNLDTKNLSVRNQVLLVVARGNGHCLGIYILQRQESAYKKVWETDEIPKISGGGGFCHDGAFSGNFRALATQAGTIGVQVPRDSRNRNIYGRLRLIIYAWNGREYNVSRAEKY